MELKTDSGVSITIIEAGSSKVLIFDKSVRAIELNEEELSKISAPLTSKSNNVNPTPTAKRKRTKVESQADSSSGVS
jgi:hypothetical protein